MHAYSVPEPQVHPSSPRNTELSLYSQITQPKACGNLIVLGKVEEMEAEKEANSHKKRAEIKVEWGNEKDKDKR